MLDFSQPGSDGDASYSFESSGFGDWHRGVVYTVRPEMLAPLPPSEERRIGVYIRRWIGKGEPFTAYADLYRRANSITAQRATELTCSDPGCSLHTWTVSHTWGRFEGRGSLLYTIVTTGVVSLRPGDPRPQGEDAPDAEALLAPGGLTREALAALPPDHAKRIDEIYNDFDSLEPSGDTYMFSYGEYVLARQGLDFAPIIQRAEQRARAYIAEPASRIVRREWFGTSSPDLAVVHVYFRG